ncbi:MAG: hypothetical protein CMP07_12795 [Xanthomonadales bacterium]|nr:hypothetical protein [Xanthomonadales bacterium]|tara:strand:- start:46 stop:693 length:648 start_codon:yes stop_codon:yes gene_type:complete
MSGKICVLTGDIVRSTRMESERLDELMRSLSEGADNIRRWTEPSSPRLERFRGDGWQFALIEPVHALRAGLLFRSIVKNFDQDADTRIAFGIGFGALGTALAGSQGSAFELSGMHLEEIKGPDRWAIDGDFKPRQLLPLIKGLFAACEGLSSGWTSKQAEVFGLVAAPEEPKYAQVAESIGVRPQTVQDHFAKAGGRALLRAIHGFESALGRKTA